MRRYVYLRLYRVVDSAEEQIRSELELLGEFIKARAMNNRDLSYITITLIHKNSVDGYIIVGGDNIDKAIREREIIQGFIDSHLEAVAAEKIDGVKKTIDIPLPLKRHFFLESMA